MSRLVNYFLLCALLFSSLSQADIEIDVNQQNLAQFAKKLAKTTAIPSADQLQIYIGEQGGSTKPKHVKFYRSVITKFAKQSALPITEGTTRLVKIEPQTSQITGLFRATWFNEDYQTYYQFDLAPNGNKYLLFNFGNLTYETSLLNMNRLLLEPEGGALFAKYAAAQLAIQKIPKVLIWYTYDSLPESVKNHPLLHNGLQQTISDRLLSDNTNDSDYNQYYNNYEKRSINLDPQFLMFKHITAGDYEAAEPYIKRLQKIVGDDPWFDEIAFVGLLNSADKVSFTRAYEIFESNTETENYYYLLLDYFVNRDQYDDAMLVVNVLYSKFDTYLDTPNMRLLGEHYTRFSKTKLFQQWLDDRGLNKT